MILIYPLLFFPLPPSIQTDLCDKVIFVRYCLSQNSPMQQRTHGLVRASEFWTKRKNGTKVGNTINRNNATDLQISQHTRYSPIKALARVIWPIDSTECLFSVWHYLPQGKRNSEVTSLIEENEERLHAPLQLFMSFRLGSIKDITISDKLFVNAFAFPKPRKSRWTGYLTPTHFSKVIQKVLAFSEYPGQKPFCFEVFFHAF